VEKKKREQIKRSVRLKDIILVAIGSSVKEGIVTCISERGIVLKHDCGATFYKWCHVVKIKQNINTLCIAKELKGE